MARKRSGKHYFTKDHENAIIQYVATDDQRLRTELYSEYIGPAFNEMVDKIVYTYKFTNLPNIDFKEFEKVINTRRSVRVFKKDIIPIKVVNGRIDGRTKALIESTKRKISEFMIAMISWWLINYRIQILFY